ncbi:MAG: 3'-5' exonuclease [Cytophagaceae bacterium]|nr:3'-5' exonuclease [Cytophagaceae bacterium]
MPFLILDLEMTGTDPGWHEIIQLGAVLCDDNWLELGQHLTNVYPENKEAFTQSAVKVHGLTLGDLDDAPMIYDVLPEFETWILGKLSRKPGAFDNTQVLRDVIIGGQSVINDINFLRFAYRDEKMKWPFSNVLLDLHTLAYFVFDILRQNGQKTPRSLSLGAIAEYFGFVREGDLHNALEDAVLTAKCFREVMKLGRGFRLA